uniref:Uncharacterized protein n=1 Tax=Panagrolaimus davidi TaxID=227884 RepID=A0A914Q5B2_9BILA
MINTVSLHIKAFKNELEAESDSCDAKKVYENGKIEKSASKSVIQPEFSRQQESNDSKIPEVAQYRSSQRLRERAKKMQSQQQAPPTTRPPPKIQSSQQPNLKIQSKIMQQPAQLSAIKKSKEEVAQATQRSTKKLVPPKLPQPPKLQLSDGEKKAEKTPKECQGSESSEDELDKELKEVERKAKEVDRETKRVEREAKEAELEAKEADLELLLAEKGLELAAWKMFANFGRKYLNNDPPETSISNMEKCKEVQDMDNLIKQQKDEFMDIVDEIIEKRSKEKGKDQNAIQSQKAKKI